MIGARSLPNLLTGLRLGLIPVLSVAALAGSGVLVGVGLLAAGLSDFLDGQIARRLRIASDRGARLDAIADTSLLLSALAWLVWLHPEIVRDNTMLIAVAFAIYVATGIAGLVKFRRLGNPRLLSSKIAGACLYAFALVTFVTGAYEPSLLMLAAFTLIATCVEALIAQLLMRTAEPGVVSVLADSALDQFRVGGGGGI